MILLCKHFINNSINNSSLNESLLSIILAGLGGALIATLIAIFYDKHKQNRKIRNLFKGFISEIKINEEYLKHNYGLAELIGNNRIKPSIFIPVRNCICEKVLTSGEIKLDNTMRRLCDHYLVTLDHLNQMIKTLENTDFTSNEYTEAIERIKRYCRSKQGAYDEKFDFVLKHANEIQKKIFDQKKYLNKYLQ